MIVVLNCVAVVLVLAGAAAALFGADTIRNESGAAWLISGSISAGSGFVLLALAAMLAELRRIRRGLADMAVEVLDVASAAPPPPPFGAPGALAVGAGVVAGAALAAAVAGQHAEAVDGAAPGDDAPAPSEPVVAEDPVGASAETQENGGDQPVPEQSIDLDDPELVNPDEDLFADLADAAGGQASPHLVRTYASGGNTYLMYSDGSIEADMEDGRHRFPSMAALRHFVETGEGGERIAPDDQPSSSPPTAPTANA